MALSFKVRGIEASQHKSVKFILISIYFLGLSINKEKLYARINREFHLVEGLKANMLARKNIISLEEISIIISNSFTLIASCAVTIPIYIRQRSHLI